MAKKIKLTVAPKKTLSSVKKTAVKDPLEDLKKVTKSVIYKPRVRLTAHIKRK